MLAYFLDMAETKSTTKKKTAPASPKPTKAVGATKPTNGASSAAFMTRVDTILDTLIPKWDTLTNDERRIFTTKYSDAQCEDKGGGTRSEGVLSEAVGWAATIDKALPDFPVELRRYPRARFAWFLECIRALAAERTLQQTKGGAAGVLKTAVDQAEKAALTARKEVVDSLEELVEGDATEEDALSNALGSTDRPDRTVASMGTVCAYARRWLTRDDAGSKKRVELAGLTLAEVETAENAAATLVQATAGKTLEGATLVRDSPAVNRIEGRVLLEMRAAMRVFNKANVLNKQIPKLVPGSATRRALVSRSGKGSGEDVAEAPAAGAGNGGAPA